MLRRRFAGRDDSYPWGRSPEVSGFVQHYSLGSLRGAAFRCGNFECGGFGRSRVWGGAGVAAGSGAGGVEEVFERVGGF